MVEKVENIEYEILGSDPKTGMVQVRFSNPYSGQENVTRGINPVLVDDGNGNSALDQQATIERIESHARAQSHKMHLAALNSQPKPTTELTAAFGTYTPPEPENSEDEPQN